MYIQIATQQFFLDSQVLNHVTFVNLTYQFVGNKAKVRISKRMFQENKARQIFRKTNISYPLIHTRMIRRFALLLTSCTNYTRVSRRPILGNHVCFSKKSAVRS